MAEMHTKYDTCKDDKSLYFLTEPDEKYLCAFCGNILLPPVLQTSCGHRISSTCIDRMFTSDVDKQQCPANEEDCNEISKDEMHADRATSREIQRKVAFCFNVENGCDVQNTLSKLEEHEPECGFRTLKCSMPGCEKTVLAKDIKHHEGNECEYLPTYCEICNGTFPLKEIQNGHKKTCKPKIRECLFGAFGCSFTGILEDLNKHNNEKSVFHLSLLTRSLQDLYTEKDTLKTLLTENVKDIHDLKNIIQNSNSDNRLSQKDIEKLDQVHQRMTDLETSVSKTVDQTIISGIVKSIQEHGTRMQTHERHIQELSNKCEEQGTDRELKTQVNGLESTVSTYEARMAESDLRFRLLETAAFNGRLVWKLTQYRRRKNDALEGRTTSLYSQPFYTSIHGYKMCGRVYLNGDGMGKGTHISVFFVIMRGEYDALLAWPFKQKITLSILDQSGNGRHITDSFRPDPTSGSFKRPTQEMNIASGSPMFATQADVENENYVQNDVMFIKIAVDTSTLPEI